MGQAKKKQMDCPVVGRRIKPDECGENRISNYDCPADCPHNPWSVANYDRALEIYDRLMDKKMARLRDEQIARHGYWPEPPSAQRDGPVHVVNHFLGKFFQEREADGTSFKERWKADGYQGLNNDQRAMLDAESKGYATVFEIRRVLNDRCIEAVDVFGGCEPFLLVDRALAAMACRFMAGFSVLYECPHYHRMNGFMILVPEVSGLGCGEVAMEIVRHLGGPAATGKVRTWMTEHIERVAKSMNAVGDARREAMLRSMDLACTKSVYELKHCTVERCEKTMEGRPFLQLEEMDAQHVEDGFAAEWVWTTDDSAVGFGRGVLGSVFLHEDGYVQLEASSAARRDDLKGRFEKLMGRKVRFSRERTDDLALQRAEWHSRCYDPELVPERLLRNVEELQASCSQIPLQEGDFSKAEIERRIEDEFNRTYLDSPIPLLDGRTPRQAAKNPALRPALVELMKGCVRSHDESNLRRGSTTDINWMLEELGLGEINFPPPPPRKSTEPGDDEEHEDEDEEFGLDSSGMLDGSEVRDRIQDIDEDFSPAQLHKCFAAAFPEMHAFLVEACNDEGVPDLADPVLELAAQTGFMHYRPDERPIPGFPDELVVTLMEQYIEEIENGEFEDLLNGLCQPMVALHVYERLKEILRFGEADPLFMNFFVALVAFSEAVSIHFEEMLQLLLERVRP